MDAAPKVQGVNYLEEILAVKRAEIERMRPLAQRYAAEALAAKNFRGFTAALHRRDEQLAIIGEVKKVSPSAGLIEPNYDAALKAQEYVSQGAEAISVLTDKKFFQGSMADLVAVRDAVSVPVLRKDFILDETQVAQSAAAGADAILLIVAALSQEELLDLVQAAAGYHIDALVEVHSEEELDRAMGVGATLIGINNRDLHTFEIDLSITETLCELVPNDIVLVSESGYKTMEDVGRAHRSTVDAILVGEALMRGEITIEQLRSVREL
jgi:indole-3-glycerol phosphate synthase